MIQWKQRLYAFLLRRILGPILDTSATQKLHDSIDVSLQEGKFVLTDISLDSKHLTELLTEKVPGLSIRTARIDRLEILLTLHENHHPKATSSASAATADDTSATKQSSFAWRAMKLGTLNESFPAVSLIAEVSIDGISLELEPIDRTRRKPARSSEKSADTSSTSSGEPEEESSSKSVIGSYIDAALASLKLKLKVHHLKIRLCHFNEHDSKEVFLAIKLSKLCYTDVDSDEGPPMSRYKMAVHKLLEVSDIVVFSGQSLRPSASSHAPLETVTSQSTIALLEGSGQIFYRVIEYDHELSPDEVDHSRNASNGGLSHPRQLQQDIEVKLNHQLNISLDELSLIRIQDIFNGFSDISEYSTDIDVTASKQSCSVQNIPHRLDDMGADRDDLRVLTGLMRQYKEAHLAGNQLRGGILVPSNAYLEDCQVEDDEEETTFDIFFDANDQSFYNAASVMAKSILQPTDESSQDESDRITTKVRLHLMTARLKILFQRPEHVHLSAKFDEYVLATFDDVSISMSSSHRTFEIFLSISHVDVEDAQIKSLHASSSTDVSSLADDEGTLEINKVLGFVSEPLDQSSENGDILLSEAPCINVHWKQTKSRDTINVTLMPLELVCCYQTVSSMARLQSNFVENSPRRHIRQQPSNAEATGRKQEPREMDVSCMCHSITLSIPLVRRVDTCALFERSGVVVPNAEVGGSSICVLLENVALELKSKNDLDLQPGESSLAGTFSFHHFLVFAVSPERDSIGFGTRMLRKDVMTLNGRLEVNPRIPVSIAFVQVVPNGTETNPGRDSFPIVPAISSFKARQEDDDASDATDPGTIVVPKANEAEADSRKSLRASDPQISMLTGAEKSNFVVTIHVPEVFADLTMTELGILLQMMEAAKPPTNGSIQPTKRDTERTSPPSSKASSIAFMCESITLALREDAPFAGSGRDCSRAGRSSETFAFILAANQIKSHALFNESNMQHFRIMCHDPCLYSANIRLVARPIVGGVMDAAQRAKLLKEGIQACSSEFTAPLLFRSHMFTPISQDTPSVLLDIIDMSSVPSGEDISKQKSVYLTVYHLTYRYDVDSQWTQCLMNLLSDVRAFSDPGSESIPKKQGQEEKPVKLPSMTRFFVSCADINLDYTSPTYFESMSRSIVRVGDLRFSSNVMVPAGPMQAYRLSIGDLYYHVSNARNSHFKENAELCRSSWLVLPGDSRDRDQSSSAFGSMPEAILREIGFVNVLSLDMVDAVLSHRETVNGEKSAEPMLSIALTLGNLSIQACKDSFNCFANSLSELQAKLTALTDAQVLTMLEEDSCTTLCESSVEGVKPNEDATPMPWKEEQYLIPEIEVKPEDHFLLDGYDWTSIDHDPLMELEISPGEEQSAGWYNKDQNMSGTLPLTILQQHFPIQVIADPLSEGDMGVTRFAGKDAEISVRSRLLIHKLNIRIRFFDGYDWPDSCSHDQREAALRPGKMFVIEPLPPAVSKEKTKKRLEEADTELDTALSRRTLLMGELLDLEDEETSTFSKDPLAEDRATMIGREKHRQLNCRKSSVFFQVSLNEVTLRIDSLDKSDTHRLQSVMEVAVSNFFIAETVSTSKPIKMFGEWANDDEHPRDTRFGNLMLSMATWAPRTKVKENHTVESDECQVIVQLLPMRLLLDQRAIAFIRAFSNNDAPGGSPEQPGKKWSDGLHLIPPPHFKSFKIKPWKVKVDYRPARMDVAALREGSIVELVNISPIHRMVITLSEVTVFHSHGMGPIVAEVASSWVKEICATQLHKFLANARPFEPFTDVGQGLTDLVLLPYEAFQAGDSVRKALRKGVKSLADTIVFQTLTTSSGLTKYAADLMADILGGGRPNAEVNPLPSRPAAVPKGIGDVRRHACESLARGIQTANYKIVVVPYREFSRNGVTGAVTSMIKGIPVLVVAPLTGATEAASYTLLGARNALRPDIRREEEASMSLH
ncbi:MAG: hypothetical protein SGILL_000613 [Bacillariaceae sp.]